MNIYSNSLCKSAVALSLFMALSSTALTSTAHAQAVIMGDGIVSDQGQDVVMVPERDIPINPRGTIVEDKIGLKLQLGFSRGKVKGHEYVYDAQGDYGGGKNDKISELIWQSKNVVMFGGKASIAVSSRVNLHGEAWISIHDKSEMDDYDWLDGKHGDWTHWSTHDDTEIARGSILDFAVGFSALKTKAVTIDLLAGFKRDSWKWASRGGDYIYSSAFAPDDFTDKNFRDREGHFPVGEAAITYTQTYSTPYLGIAADVNFGRFNVAGKAIGSEWSKGSHDDTHHMRNTKFHSDLHNGSMYMLEGEASFAFTERLALGAGYSYTKYEVTRGEESANDVAYWGDSSGASLEHSKVNVFLKSKF